MAVFNRSNYWKNKQGENLSLLGAGQTKTFEVKCQRRQNSPLHESTSAHPSPKLMTTLCARSCKWTFSFCWQRDTSARTSKNARFQDARMNEKENSLTIIWEGEMGRGANGRRRGGSTCFTDAPWRDGGMVGRKTWPQTPDTSSQPGHVYCPPETIRSAESPPPAVPLLHTTTNMHVSLISNNIKLLPLLMCVYCHHYQHQK